MIRVAKISCIVLLFALTSCYDEEQFPDTPHIEFRSLEFVDTQTSDSLILKFYFEDGDANLGVFENDFSPEYNLFVDSEPKILTEANIDDAVPPVFLAPLFLDNVVPIRFSGNTITIIPGASSYPAFIQDEVYTDNPDTIDFDCPDVINQNLALFDTTDVTIYDFVEPRYDEIFTQDINSPVPALYRETFYNMIVRFQRIINGEPETDEDGRPKYIDFGEVFGETGCSGGPESFNSRIPFFVEDARSGTITFNMISFFLRIGLGDDPFRMLFFVYDRSGNKSNEVITPPFVLSEITRN